jgi:hypothetical protein
MITMKMKIMTMKVISNGNERNEIWKYEENNIENNENINGVKSNNEPMK